MTDAELLAHLEAMEGRLMARLNEDVDILQLALDAVRKELEAIKRTVRLYGR